MINIDYLKPIEPCESLAARQGDVGGGAPCRV